MSLKAISESRIATLQHEQVLVADSEYSRASKLSKVLVENDYRIVAHLENIDQLVEKLDLLSADVLIIGLNLPNQHEVALLTELKKTSPLPTVVFLKESTPEIVQQILRAGIDSLIVGEIQLQRLPSIISIAVARFKEQQQLVNELAETRLKLAERKILARAKGLLMEQKGLNEDEAYQSLRKMAMDKGQPIRNISENVIEILGGF